MNNDLVLVQLDRLREVRFNHTALKTLVEITGKGLEELESDLTSNNFDMVEKLVYCGLLKDAKDNGETMTPDRAVELMDEAPVYVDLLHKVFEAWNKAFGAKPQAEGNQQPAKQPAKENSSTGKKASE